jgi:hypothetical protein
LLSLDDIWFLSKWGINWFPMYRRRKARAKNCFWSSVSELRKIKEKEYNWTKL